MSGRCGRQKDGMTGTEEARTDADTAGTDADKFGNPGLPAPGEKFNLFLTKAARDAANGVSSGRYFKMSSPPLLPNSVPLKTRKQWR
jgi:hypothetical protein